MLITYTESEFVLVMSTRIRNLLDGTYIACFFIAYLFLADYLFFILQGVGDSSQGFANFVLFCLFTEKIRKKFRLSCIRFTPYCCRFQEKEECLFESTTNFPLNETSDFTSYGARDCFIAYNSYAVMTA